MMLLDVNVLIHAFRPESANHRGTKQWLERLIADERMFGMSDGVLCGFVRVVTQPPFDPITPIEKALDFAAALRRIERCRIVTPGAAQWAVFDALCRRNGSHGRIAQDMYWASFALELDCEFITFDTRFRDVPGLRWRSPLESGAHTNPR